MSFWLKYFLDLLLLDLVIAVLAAGGFLYYQERRIPAESKVINRYFEQSTDLLYVIETENGERYPSNVTEYMEYAAVSGTLLLVFEGVSLFFALFRTRSVRKKMRPLNELAKRADEMSRASFDQSKIDNLEQVISSVSPDAAEVNIHTGDKDLQSIEAALNSLIARMKASQRQQARFVSDASHELRTPISVIQGYVNMLDRWGKEDENVLEESIEALKHESQHMKDLIEQLLFLARGDSGRNILHRTVFDLDQVMQEVWEESEMIDEKHRYVFEPCAGTMLSGDIAMVKQSIRIFVQNASKYSAEGDTIKLGVKKEDHFAVYLVQDEGIGMQDTEVVHIFERFYRSDEARSEETGGSGLGLSIAKWIVDAHGGTIEVLSRQAIGTRFTVRFPLSKETEPEKQEGGRTE